MPSKYPAPTPKEVVSALKAMTDHVPCDNKNNFSGK